MAASFIENGKIVCDVGCDHGKLSLFLVQNNLAEKIIATDINKAPLQKAVELFMENGLSHKAQFILTNGLQGIDDTKDITHVVIAGLGGDTMCSVISSAHFIKENQVDLVLLPAQSGNRIRQYLYENGFSILQEKTVAEKGKFYSCINAKYTGEITKPTVYDCFVGQSHKNTGESAKGYFSMILLQLEKRQNGLFLDTGNKDHQMEEAINRLKNLIEKL